MSEIKPKKEFKKTFNMGKLKMKSSLKVYGIKKGERNPERRGITIELKKED